MDPWLELALIKLDNLDLAHCVYLLELNCLFVLKIESSRYAIIHREQYIVELGPHRPIERQNNL
jgi:hypothetical protein